MPYYLSKETKNCVGRWAVVNENGELKGCHDTKEQATAHMVAISLATNEPVGGTYPPEAKKDKNR